MANHVSDTWQAMCHIAWKRPIHVGHMASHVSSCMVLLRPINMGVPIQFRGATNSVRGGAVRRRRRKGGKEKRKGGEEKRKERRKEKKKGEEERKKKEEKEGVLRSE